MDDAEYVPYAKIKDFLPICKGDILYVYSDVLGLAKVCRENGEDFEGELFIQSLQEVVGGNGTLLFPSFNWDFCKGIAFDYRYTKGKTGALGNVALKMPGFNRTQHPIYSFAVWGKAQTELAAMKNHSAWGEDSPFAFLHRNNGKVLTIGLPKAVSTFIHYVEQMVGVDYRYHKDFCAPYVDEVGSSGYRTYSMYVRNLDIDPQPKSREPLNDIMRVLGIRKETIINSVPFHVLDLAGVFDVISLALRYNINCIYKFTKAN